MRFRKKWFGPYVSDAGFSIAFENGRAGITYREANWEILVDSEMLVKGWVIWPKRMWVGAFGGLPVQDEALRARVVESIKALFDFYGWHLEIS